MAVAVVTGILGKFGEFLFDIIRSEYHLDHLFCLDTNIQKLQTQLRDLKATREGVQLWVVEARNNLRSVPEADTWLIEANNKIAEAAAIIESEARVQTGCLHGWCGPRYSLSRKAAIMTQDLGDLRTEGIKYIQLFMQSLPPTRFKVFESRNLIVKQIIEALKDGKINLVELCGMGGVGKTEMVQHVAERVKQERLFNKVAFAVVSQEPNLEQLQSHIADMLDLQLNMGENPILRSNQLRQRLLQNNEKILVILDDVWEEFDLEKLGFPLEGGNNKSCKMLFTSRNRNLWKGIPNKRCIQLEVLVGEEPWHLFREKVGVCADSLDLLPLAKQIVNECGGLPLALVTIGRALTNEHDQRHWNDALRQLRTPCSESLLSEVPAKVYQALDFSYNFLNGETAKKLFLFCCLFPEDYEIPIEDLVRYGIGLRWFEGIDKVDEVRDRVNVLVDQLKSCYLLLDGDEGEGIKMHDVVRDVAISIAAKDKHGFMTIHGAKSREWPKKVTYELNTSISVMSNEIVEFPGGLRCSKLEFLLIECRNDSLKIPSNFFEGMRELKVLDLEITEDISLLPSSLQFLSNLSTLHLDYCQKFDNISVIGKLLNLEILCFRRSDIEELPKEIERLVNLKLLDLTRCDELKRIAPGVISALVQLQELYLGDCKIIWEREGKEGGENASLREFESLSNLNTLAINIEDVKCLPRIPLFSKLTKYSICIGCDEESFSNFDAAHITSVGKLLKLCGQCTIPSECVNSLLRSSAVLELRGMGSEDAVQELFREGVEGLRHLKELVIDGCATPKCFVNTMEWVPRTPNAIPPIFPILEKLKLRNLPNLKKICHYQLPTGSFGKLKRLNIKNCDRMEEVIWKEKGEDDATNKMEFPALESMTLERLPMLIGFCRGTDEIEFPQLKKLHLRQLPQLQWLFLNSSNLFSESMENHNATFRSLFSHKSMTQCILQLQELEIRGCKMMSTIFREEDSHGEILVDNIEFTQLTILRLDDLQNLVSIFPKVTTTVATSSEHIQNPGQSLFNEKVAFPSLEELELHGCQNVNEIWCNQLQTGSFNKLFSLDVSDCGSLRNMFSPFMARHLVHLKMLSISRCSMMEEVVAKEEDEEDEEGRINRTPLPKLEYLKLKDLPECSECFVNTMEWVPRTPNAIPPSFPILEKLELVDLPNLKKICHCQLSTGSFGKLKHLKIKNCDRMEEVIWKEKGEDEATSKMEFPALESMTLKGLPMLIGFCRGTVEIEFPQLKKLRLGRLPQLKWLFLNSSNPFSESMENHNATFRSLFSHKVALPSLEKLKLKDLDNLEGLGHIPISVGSYSKLRKVHVEYCSNLLCVFPSQFLRRLRNLEDLTVENCSLLEEVFELEMVDCKEQESEMLSLLKSLKLKHLPQLDYISKRDPIGFTYISQLSILHVHDCDNLRYLFPHSMKCMLQLQELDIRRCKMMSRIVADEKGQGKSSVDKIGFAQLKILRLYDLPNLVSFFSKVIATSTTSTERHQNVMQTLFNEKVVFPTLEVLELEHLDNLEGMGCCPPSSMSLSKLRNVHVRHCSKLPKVFQAQLLTRLQNLEELSIMDCSLLEKVFELEVVDCTEHNSKIFSLLKSLKLKSLPQLNHISERDPIGLMYIPRLSILHIDDFDNLRFLFSQSMAQCILQLQELEIRGCKMMSTIFREEDSHGEIMVDNIAFTQLKILRLHDLQNLVSIFPKVTTTVATSSEHIQNPGQSLFNEKVAFPSLEKLELRGCQNVNEIWCNQLQIGSFNKLCSLHVSDCGSLRNMFSPFIARHLVHLKMLFISGCSMMEEVVAKEEDEEDEEGRINRTPLPKLEYLKLKDLPECSECFVNTMEWVPRTPNAIPPIFPNLERLYLIYLPNLRKICHCQLPTGSFGKLEHLEIHACDGMEEVIWKEKGEDDATNKMEFPALESMTLWSLPMFTGFCRGTDEIEFPQLKKLRLQWIPQLKWLFLNSSNPFSESMENHNATFLSFFRHKVALPSLEELELAYLDNLEGLGHIPISVGSSFPKLRKLRVEHSGKWLYVSPSQFLTRLPNLQELSIGDCSLLEEVADCTEHNSKIFPLLKSLELKSPPQWNHISERDPIGLMYIPRLSILHIDDFDNLRFLFSQSMAQCILQLQELEIRRCKMMSTIFREEDSHGEILVDNIAFTQLKILRLDDLQNLVSIFPKVTTTVATSSEHIQNSGQSLFNEKVAFPSLEKLELRGCQNVNEIWCNQLQIGSFNKLCSLHVSDCGSLRNMFSPFMARHLVHLKVLIISGCSMMEEVVAKEEDEEDEEERISRTPLPKLESLELGDLPELKSFCHITHNWKLPLVDDITVLNCPKMKTFSPGVICTPKLQRVFVNEWRNKWSPGIEGEDWLWISDLNQTITHLIEKHDLADEEGENEETCETSDDGDGDGDGDEETRETSHDSYGDDF